MGIPRQGEFAILRIQKDLGIPACFRILLAVCLLFKLLGTEMWFGFSGLPQIWWLPLPSLIITQPFSISILEIRLQKFAIRVSLRD